MNEKINYYDLLNIKMDATEEEIKNAYRREIKKWHPDLNNDPNASKISSMLNDAKEILLDKDKRKVYDESLNHPKKEVYENLNKKQASRENNTYQKETKKEEETKYYTKWEYFKLYLKYYNVSIFRKIIATIFVLLETILCFILDMINIILAYFIIYTYEVLGQILILLGIILFFLVGINFINEDMNLSMMQIVLYAIGGILSISISILLPEIVKILLQKNPTHISKLNMFLFKVSIGYK